MDSKNVTFSKPPILNFEKRNNRFSPGRYGELVDLHGCHVRLSLKRSFYIAKKAKNAVFSMSTETE